MLHLSGEEKTLFKNGMLKYILFPTKLFVKELEVHCVGNEEFALVTDVTFGALSYFLHAKEIINDYGFAQPHELADHLKKRWSMKQCAMDSEWTCLKLRYIEWPKDVKAVDAVALKLRFLSNMNGARKQN